MPGEALLFYVDTPRFQPLKHIRFSEIEGAGLIQPFLANKTELIIVLNYDIIIKLKKIHTWIKHPYRFKDTYRFEVHVSILVLYKNVRGMKFEKELNEEQICSTSGIPVKME